MAKRHASGGVVGHKETCQVCGATRQWWGHKTDGRWEPGQFCSGARYTAGVDDGGPAKSDHGCMSGWVYSPAGVIQCQCGAARVWDEEEIVALEADLKLMFN